ncbi:MAG: TrmH family RNA methyltransferase [Candidatus Paceibacterota bacterium]
MAKIKDIRLLLDNIRSVHNVGSIFRTAETVGVTKIYCIDTTPTPTDRFNRKRNDLAKVALGAEDLVPWEYLKDSISLVKRLKKEGFKIVALEQAENSINYKKIKSKEKVLLILGNEVGGVSKQLLNLSDEIAEIPLKGKKESLNVSVAGGIMMFELL